MEPAVAAYVEADPDFGKFFAVLVALADMVLPRCVQEGKKYATITIGCTGGRHRSVHLIEKLATYLTSQSAVSADGPTPATAWRVHVTHRELAREGIAAGFLTERPVARLPDSDLDNHAGTLSIHPQEA